ncbi:hypothetical protein [Micromonospora sp. NPDC047074]|uniref:hypothetical protein n=1 Tax=Micromonospora sp. NPDC047074 TaxID=3154339 RepID=UPI00340EDE15
MTRALPEPVRAVRRWGTDPLVPFLLFSLGALAAAAYGHVLTWAMIGGLAGYTLSGSV